MKRKLDTQRIKNLIDEGYTTPRIANVLDCSVKLVRRTIDDDLDQSYMVKLNLNAKKAIKESRNYTRFWGRSYGI